MSRAARKSRTCPEYLKQARKLLSDERLLAFFRAAADEDRVTATRMMHRSLEELGSLEAAFAEYGGDAPWRMHIQLTIEQESPRTFRITFGFAGGNVGDGGTYRVVYSGGSKVQRLELGEWWIH